MKNKDISSLVVREVKKVVDREFITYTGDILNVIKNYGFSDFKALGLASAVSNFLAKACTTKDKYSSQQEVLVKTEKVKKEYLKNLEDVISKKQLLNFDDINYYANETLINLLQDNFNIAFSVGHTLPGCFERSSKKEKY